MSDFSYSAKCPFCGHRFAPDDGGCGCQGEQAYYEGLEEEEWAKEAEEEERYDCPIHGKQDGSECPRC
jgi:hypothetical protein